MNMKDQSTLILNVAVVLVLLLLLLHKTDAKMEIISSKLDVQVGEEILLICKAGGEGKIEWQKDGIDIDESKVISMDETTSKLNMKEASLPDAGRYTCLCEFDNGHRDETDIELYVHEGPSFGSTVTYHEFLEGSNAMIPCLVTGKPEVEVRWMRDREEIYSNEGNRIYKLADNAVYFGKVRREDAGTYVCHAQITGRPIMSQLSVSVVVNAPPTVHLKEEVKKVLAGPETNVSLLCLVDGLPTPNITWFMPKIFDPSHHHFNSDSSQLTITSVARADYGEYICTAINKITESSATLMLHVFEAPEVFVSAEKQSVSVGERVSVSCNVSGHPQPQLYWLNKHNGRTVDARSGPIHVVDGMLVIDEVAPSDGGLYSCMAVSITGNASRDVAIHTQPGPPHHLLVLPGPASVSFSLKAPLINGGTPITNYVLQWKQSAAEKWSEITVSASDSLIITSLKPYTLYKVRLAAMNAIGVGQFSDTSTIRTQGIREPDSPVLSSSEMKKEGNSVSVPIKHADDGGTPLLYYNVQYKQDKERTKWEKMQLPSNSDSVSLRDLSYSSDYQLEVAAVNANGSSIPAVFNFTTAEQPASSMTKGSVVGIVMVIFLVVFLVVDVTCCYRNRCGLLMTIAVKLFGQKVPGLKMLEEVPGTTNGVKLNGIPTPRGSVQHVDTGVQTLTRDERLTEVTCDKAPLTQHEKKQPDRDLHIDDA